MEFINWGFTTGEKLSRETEEVFKFGVRFQKCIKKDNLRDDHMFDGNKTGLNLKW